MNFPERFEEKNIVDPVILEQDLEGLSHETLANAFDDGMEEPIQFPDVIDEGNCMQVFGGVFPEGLSPDMFKDGVSITRLEQ